MSGGPARSVRHRVRQRVAELLRGEGQTLVTITLFPVVPYFY